MSSFSWVTCPNTGPNLQTMSHETLHFLRRCGCRLALTLAFDRLAVRCPTYFRHNDKCWHQPPFLKDGMRWGPPRLRSSLIRAARSGCRNAGLAWWGTSFEAGQYLPWTRRSSNKVSSIPALEPDGPNVVWAAPLAHDVIHRMPLPDSHNELPQLRQGRVRSAVLGHAEPDQFSRCNTSNI